MKCTKLKSVLWIFLFSSLIILFNTGYTKAQNTITGKVIDKNGSSLPGVNIFEKSNPSNGVISGNDGTYRIDISSGETVLSFSFIGFINQDVPVAGKKVINVSLVEQFEDLDEVVVTALGITRDQKSLGYSVGEVSGEDLTKVTQENVLDAMAGKVSGVQISSTGGPGSSVSIIIRGATSLNSDNQPLFVIDGVPVANTLNNVSDLGGVSVDYGNAISDLNPNDVESISILKGPSAAALYGSRAGNGVVMITTKSGAKKEKGIGVSFNTGVTFDKPYKFLPQQTRFTSGVFGLAMYDEAAGYWFGPETDTGVEAPQWEYNGKEKPLVSRPGKTEEFLNTGTTYNNNLSVFGNYDKGNFRLSLADMYSKGVVPNTDLHRKTVSLATSYNVTDDFRVSANINIIENGSDNRSVGGKSAANVLFALDQIPPHMSLEAFSGDYWEEGQEGRQQRVFAPGKGDNPYFLANELTNSFMRNRVYGNMQFDWQIIPKLSLMGRVSLDRYSEQRESKIPWSYSGAPWGAYGIQNLYNKEINSDFLATYKDEFGNFGLSVSGGGNYRNSNGSNLVNKADRLAIPELYTISNAEGGPTTYYNGIYNKVVYSVYGMANLSYKGMVYLDLTARNDWSSTLPENNRSYFYPSISTSLLISEMIEMPSSINLIKLRAGAAQVGNDTSPYGIVPSLGIANDWGDLKRVYVPGSLLSEDLKPEIATSYEIGGDFTFFDNRLTLSPTYYQIKNKNQILNITDMPASSGYSSKKINAGLVQSEGWEIGIFTTPVKKANFVWDLNFTISRNRTKILELVDDMPYFTLYEQGGVIARTKVGEEIGDLWGESFLKVEDESSEYYGYPILIHNEDGATLQDAPEEDRVKVGNFNHDFLMGIQTSFSYKNLHLSANINWRQGGQFFSDTYKRRLNNGKVEELFSGTPYPEEFKADLTDYIKAHPNDFFGYWVGGMTADLGGFPYDPNSTSMYDVLGRMFMPGSNAFIPGVYIDENGEYVENLGGPETIYAPAPLAIGGMWHQSDLYIFDASFIKLREIALTYDLPYSVTSIIKSQRVSVSLFAKNIMLWTENDKNIDPERAFSLSGTGFKQGLESFNIMPWIGSLGFRLSVEF